MKKTLLLYLIMIAMVMSACQSVGQQTGAESAGETLAEETVSESAEEETEELTAEKIAYPCPELRSNMAAEKPALNEDFWQYVNYDALKGTEIPAGKSNVSNFTILDQKTTDDLVALLKEGRGEGAEQVVYDYFRRYIDWNTRNAEGWAGLSRYIDAIIAAPDISSMIDLLSADAHLSSMCLPVDFFVVNDFEDSVYLRVKIFSPVLDLEDSAEYTELTDYGENLKAANTAYYGKLLAKYGYDDETANTLIEQRYAFESKLAKHIYALEVSYQADYLEITNNPYTKKGFLELAAPYPMETLIQNGYLPDSEKYIVTEPDYVSAMSEVYCEENLEEYKAWAIISVLKYAAEATDEEAFGYYVDWTNARTGSTGMDTIENYAYKDTSSLLPELLGKIYSDHFFSAEEKAEVEEIVYGLLEVYRERLKEIDWLGEETRAYAVEKLDAMGVYVGYPDELFYDYSDFTFDKEKSFLENKLDIDAAMFEQLRKSVDQKDKKDCWSKDMAPNVLNDCCDTRSNSIYFPAAILHAPFYDKDASLAANMGGIGLCIAHEITHAFDTAGSQFDKDGNMANWWTEEDRAAFEEKTKAVGERYAMYDLMDGMSLNADLVIGESVADLGGQAAALQLLEKKEAAGEAMDYKDFFESSARMWFRILTPENMEYRLRVDPHPANCLRTNVNLSQFDKFYEVYDIKEGDFMYTAPEDRLKVW